MRRRAYFCLIIGLFLPLALSAQVLNPEEKSKLEDAINPFTVGVQTLKVKVDSVHSEQNRFTVYTSDNFSYVPFRRDNVQKILEAVKNALPTTYANAAIHVITGGKDIQDLIPRLYQDKKNKRPIFTNDCKIPLVQNMDRPYQAPKGLDGRHIALWQSHGLYYQLGLARWEWQRARVFQTVEDKYTQSYVLPYLVPMLENAGAIVMMPRERDANPYEVIVDNDRQLATSLYQETTGAQPWVNGAGKGFAYTKEQYTEFDNPFADGTFRQAQTVKKSNDQSTISWIPTIPVDRQYAVYVSYQSQPNSTSDAIYTVYHKDGKTAFKVNQKMGGGTWIYLGTFSFDKGTSGKVVLSNYSKETGTVVTADAVKFGGGMGNIARRADQDSIVHYTKASSKYGKSNMRVARNAYQPQINYPYEVSGYPRFVEGARYWMQWAGIPDSIYSPSHGGDDYSDDYKSRGIWVNYLAGGTKSCPDVKGLQIPIDLSFAFHSDAGTFGRDTIVGSLGIYKVDRYGGKYADGSSRMANHDLCDLVLSNITHDIRSLYEPNWTRRGMWDQSYFEAWTPRVPAMLLELLSHQNFADMRYGLDPRFRFTVSRAIYKGMLKFLSDSYGVDYVVQPLPVDRFSATLGKKDQVKLSWHAVVDSLEPTAMPDKYVVYKRVGNGDFDNGTVVKKTTYLCNIPSDKVVSFRVTALNKGGQSFPSEILSVGVSSQSAQKPVLIVNGFERISGPDDFVTSDDREAGFLADQDNGVPDGTTINYIGKMKEFRRAIPWTHDDSGGFGDSYGNEEKLVIAGNTFDYPALHGAAILKAGYSFVSSSKVAATEQNLINIDNYSAIDLILGKQKQSKMGRPGATPLQFKTFDDSLQSVLTTYCKNGGKVFVSGSYVASDLWFNPLAKPVEKDKQFAQDILKYKWRDNRAAVEGKIKTVASPLTETNMELAYYNLPNETSYVVESPDAIEPADECAYTAFRYSENGLSAGVVFGGSEKDHWKTVVLGFPFESLKNVDQRETLMKCILGYLLNTSK